jgi:methylmalonyl-CoA mutase
LRITERGGVLESYGNDVPPKNSGKKVLYYETLKHTGEFNIGVNILFCSKGSPTVIPAVILCYGRRKQYQIDMLNHLHQSNQDLVNEH